MSLEARLNELNSGDWPDWLSGPKEEFISAVRAGDKLQAAFILIEIQNQMLVKIGNSVLELDVRVKALEGNSGSDG